MSISCFKFPADKGKDKKDNILFILWVTDCRHYEYRVWFLARFFSRIKFFKLIYEYILIIKKKQATEEIYTKKVTIFSPLKNG